MKEMVITLGDLIVAGSIGAAAFGVVWRMSKLFERQNNRMVKLEEDHFGMSRACEVALRIAIHNPGHQVPDPRDPSKMISTPSENREHG